MRQIIYGDSASKPLQRVLEIIERSPEEQKGGAARHHS